MSELEVLESLAVRRLLQGSSDVPHGPAGPEGEDCNEDVDEQAVVGEDDGPEASVCNPGPTGRAGPRRLSDYPSQLVRV